MDELFRKVEAVIPSEGITRDEKIDAFTENVSEKLNSVFKLTFR